MLSPEATAMTSVALRPSWRIAYPLPPLERVPTKSVPPPPGSFCSPRAIERASLTPSAKSEISKPGGSLMRSSGNAAREAKVAASRRAARQQIVTGERGFICALDHKCRFSSDWCFDGLFKFSGVNVGARHVEATNGAAEAICGNAMCQESQGAI